MSETRKWKAGVADEAWKVLVCARDHAQAEALLHALARILVPEGDQRDAVAALDAVRAMSGQQIVDGLIAYRDSNLRSIENALRGLAE